MKNSDQPAFPRIAHQFFNGLTVTWADGTPGLTKREYFAANAMQAIISGVYSSSHAWASITASAKNASLSPAEYITKSAIDYADGLLAELEKTIL